MHKTIYTTYVLCCAIMYIMTFLVYINVYSIDKDSITKRQTIKP